MRELTQSRTVPLGLGDLLLGSDSDVPVTFGGPRRLAGHAAVSDALRKGLSDSRWIQRNETRARNAETLRRTIRRAS